MLTGHIIRRKDINEVFNAIDEFFNYLFNENSILTTKRPTNTKFPYYNSYIVADKKTETPEKLVLEFSVAGFNKDELSIEVIDDNLIVKGIKKKDDKTEKEVELTDNNTPVIEKEDKKYIYYVKGITEKDFELKFRKLFNSKLDSENINVSLDNGILKIEIPFKDMKPKRKVIEIK